VFGRPLRQRQRRTRDQRGAVAVEAALVLPILFTMLFGIIELTMLVKDQIATTSAARIGARVAATGAGAGPGTCDMAGVDPPPCLDGDAPKLAQEAANAIQRSGLSMPKDSIDYILVYQANAQGFPGANGSTTMPTSCATVPNCVKFKWWDPNDAFRYKDGTWHSTDINACLNRGDEVGIYMHATHSWVTGLFGDGVTVDDRAVFRFEPLGEESCSKTSLHPHP
jgi:hypothetical protein